MSVDDLINGEREDIVRLWIDNSIKENMLKYFDDTVSLYHGKDGIYEIAKTISYIADKTRSEEAVIETAKILRLYHNKKGAEKITEAIKNVAYWTRNKEAIIETAKTLALYYNKVGVEEVAETIIDTAKRTINQEATIETAKTLALYHNKKGAEKVAKAIAYTANYTESEEKTKKIAKILRLDEIIKTIGLDQNKIMTRAIVDTAHYTKSEEATIETAKTLRNIKDIYNLDSELFSDYISNISNNLSENIKYSLSLKEINRITNTYSLTMDFCKNETFQNKVKEGFFHHLNKAIDTGKTIDDKLKILNKWSDNVYTTFKDHPEDFMEFIP